MVPDMNSGGAGVYPSCTIFSASLRMFDNTICGTRRLPFFNSYILFRDLNVKTRSCLSIKCKIPSQRFFYALWIKARLKITLNTINRILLLGSLQTKSATQSAALSSTKLNVVPSRRDSTVLCHSGCDSRRLGNTLVLNMLFKCSHRNGCSNMNGYTSSFGKTAPLGIASKVPSR